MSVRPDDVLSLNTAAFMTCEQLAAGCGMSVVELSELVSYSALVPVKSDAAWLDIENADQWVFSEQCLKPLCAACKLRSDFDLDMFTVAIVLGSLQRIDALERDIAVLQQKIIIFEQENAHPSHPSTSVEIAQIDLFGKAQ